MARSKIKILISVIGNLANDSVIQFLKEKPGIKKLYIIHKVTNEPDFRTPSKKINFKKISEEFIDKLNNEWGEIKVIPIILKDSQDFHEIQHIIGKIVEEEKIASKGMLNTLEDIAIDFSGGTGIVTAALLFSAFKLRITPYYVQPITTRTDNRVDKIEINYRMGREMGKPDSPANKILKNLANSVFTVRAFEGRTFFETPEGLDEKSVLGMKTQLELNREFKEEGITRIDQHIRGLIEKNLVEEGIGYEIYKNKAVKPDSPDDEEEEPDWQLEKHQNSKYYKITKAGEDEVRILEYGVT